MLNIFLRQGAEFFDRFFRLGGDMSMVSRLLGDDELTKWWINSLTDRLMNANRFEQTVEQTLATLRTQNAVGNWGISDEVFARLLTTAPAWPKGRDAYRSLRIRWGEADEGVALTFERHAEAIKRAFPGKFRRWGFLFSANTPYKGQDVERLRLLNGNQTHHAIVEWVIINDLSANHSPADANTVRGPNSLADEGLALAWLFPSRANAIDYKSLSAWLCAGYELNVPEHGAEDWLYMVVMRRDVRSGILDMSARSREHDLSGYSVPSAGSAT